MSKVYGYSDDIVVIEYIDGGCTEIDCYDNQSGTIATGVKDSTTWVIPSSLMNLIPADTKGYGTIYVDTYNGSTKLGTKSCVFMATVPASVKPSCTLTLEDITGIDGIYGTPVQGLSKVKITVNAETAYGSPIASYSISANGASYNTATATTDTLKASGNSKVSATVTDKRGRQGYGEYPLQIQAYTPPRISKLTVHRCNADGVENDRGLFVKVIFSGSVTPLNDKNTATYSLLYKKSSETEYAEVILDGTPTEYLVGDTPNLQNNYSIADQSCVFPADDSSSYDIMIRVADRHNYTNRTTSASSGFTLMHFHSSGTGLGIGKVSEKENTMQIALDVEFNGSVIAKKGTFIADTRDANLPPDEYMRIGRGVFFEFKLCAAVDLSDTSNTYCTLITIVQWENTTGGSVKQIIFDDNRVWCRYGYNVWTSWKPILYRMNWKSAGNGVSYKVQDGMCTVCGSSNTFSISTSGVVVCTLPEIARPTVDVYGVLTTTVNNCGQLRIGTDGKVTLWNLGTTSTHWAFTISYPID